MTATESDHHHLPIFRSHARSWQQNAYVYPVVSRRSRGLSIGVNLNPDTACNFDCIYCQVDRTVEARVRTVELPQLSAELETMLTLATSGQLFTEPPFDQTPPELRRVNDIAFSGDGEPTTCPVFTESVALAVDQLNRAALNNVKIVLITDACYLTRPTVIDGLRLMDRCNGEIWAKLDAGTEAYYQLVNRPNYPLAHVIENITAAARERPICIQSLFMRVDGVGPDSTEISAYLERLRAIVDAGGKIKEVQVYTVARQPAEANVTALSNAEVDLITHRVGEEAELNAVAYYGQ